MISNYLGFLQVRVGRAESCLSKAEALHTTVRVGLLQVKVTLLAGVAGPLLHVGLAEALSTLLVTDPLSGASEVTLAHVTLRVPVAAIAAMVTLPALHPLLALTLTALQAAGHVAIDCALHHAVTFLATRRIRRREKLALAKNVSYMNSMIFLLSERLKKGILSDSALFFMYSTLIIIEYMKNKAKSASTRRRACSSS